MPVPAEVPPLTPPVTAVDAVVQPPASEPLPASQAFDLELRPTALRKVGLPAGPCGEAPAAAGGQRARRPPCYSLAWLLAGAACHAGAARMRCWPCGLVCAGNASFTAGPHACPVLRRMKLRVRTVHGETLKVEAEKSDSIAGFIAKLDLPPALTWERGTRKVAVSCFIARVHSSSSTRGLAVSAAPSSTPGVSRHLLERISLCTCPS